MLADKTVHPRYLFYACGRRAMFALTEGDTVGAARLAAEAADASAGDLPGADSVLQALHAELARQRGERTALVQHARSCEHRGHSRGRASLLGQAAVLWLESGEPERARRIVDHLAPSLGDLRLDADWLLVMCKVGEAAAGSGRTALAARCAGLVTPYAGRAVLDARATSFAGVVDDYLAVATRDREHAARARAAYRRLGADWWSRRGPLGRLHEPVTGSEGPRVLHLHPTENDEQARSWCVGREGAERTVPAMPGLEYLRLLVERAGTDVPALDLRVAAEDTRADFGSGSGSGSGSREGTLVDQQVLAEHRRRQHAEPLASRTTDGRGD